MYLSKTSHGDMNLLISDHFDAGDFGPLNKTATYEKLVKSIKVDPEDVLFLTHSGPEGFAAKKAGLSVLLIATHRRDVYKLVNKELKDFLGVYNLLFRPKKSDVTCRTCALSMRLPLLEMRRRPISWTAVPLLRKTTTMRMKRRKKKIKNPKRKAKRKKGQKKAKRSPKTAVMSPLQNPKKRQRKRRAVRRLPHHPLLQLPLPLKSLERRRASSQKRAARKN